MFHERKANRLKGYNYSSKGMYFITISSYKSEPLFGRVLRNNGSYEGVELTEIGKIIENQLKTMSDYYDYAKIINFIVMPNHIHLILEIKETSCTAKENRANAAVPMFVSSMKRFVNKKVGYDVWHRSYHDHIIRNDEDFTKIFEYISDNPRRWAEDRFYYDFD